MPRRKVPGRRLRRPRHRPTTHRRRGRAAGSGRPRRADAGHPHASQPLDAQLSRSRQELEVEAPPRCATGAESSDSPDADGAARASSSRKASSRCCRTASASCAPRVQLPRRAGDNDVSPSRSASSGCVRATRSPARSARRRKGSATSPSSRSRRSTSRHPRRRAARRSYSKPTPLYPQERIRLETGEHVVARPRPIAPVARASAASSSRRRARARRCSCRNLANSITTNPPRGHAHRPPDRRAARGGHDMQRSVKGEVNLLHLSTSPRPATCRSPRCHREAKRLVSTSGTS